MAIRPRIHAKIWRKASLLACSTYVWHAVRKLATAMPARISDATERPPRWPATYEIVTEMSAPAKAANGTGSSTPAPSPRLLVMATVAPRPAPAAMPSR